MLPGGQFLHQHDLYFFSILKVKLLMERKVAFSCTTKCCQLAMTIVEFSDDLALLCRVWYPVHLRTLGNYGAERYVFINMPQSNTTHMELKVNFM